MTTSTHVLLVDDEPRIREIYALALEDAGYTVRAAANAAEALVLLATERFEVAFIDYNLGTVSGLDLIRQMEDLVPEVYPVIIISTSSRRSPRRWRRRISGPMATAAASVTSPG